MTVSDDLTNAASHYRSVFGHAVPPDVVQMFALRPGPLLMEIRQAVALNKPVPAWLARSRVPGATAAYSEWPFSVPLEREQTPTPIE